MKFLFLLFCSLSALSPAAADDFVEYYRFGEGWTESVAWGDYDGDGDLDLAVGNYGGPNFLYTQKGTGTFSESSPFDGEYTYAGNWGDCDSDGDLDLALVDIFSQNFLYINEGHYGFDRMDQFGADQSTATAWADYDNDGDLDLAVGNFEPYDCLYENTGEGGFLLAYVFQSKWTYSLDWGDFDNDGDPDLAVATGTGPNFLHINNGDGTFTERQEFGGGYNTAVAWGDFDNDGDLDLALGNNTGQNTIHVNLGTGAFAEMAGIGEGYTVALVWGDCDNDGDLDLAAANYQEQNFLYVNNGDDGFIERPEFGLSSTYSMAWGDHDNDGDIDLAVGNNGPNYLFRNEENDMDWLAIDLAGHFHDKGAGFSNRDGVGARISVYRKGGLGALHHLLGYREVKARGGYCGQGDLFAHFGVGSHEEVDVRIVWPGSNGSRIVQDLTAGKSAKLLVHEYDPTFHLLAPAHKKRVFRFPIEFDWEDAYPGHRIGYTIEIARDADFTDIVYTANTTESEISIDGTSGLPRRRYFWRVLSRHETTGVYSHYSAEARRLSLVNIQTLIPFYRP